MQLGVGLVAADDFQFRSGRERARLEAFENLVADLAEVADGPRAHHKARRGMRRNHIGNIATMGDDAVDSIGRPHMLAQQPNRGLRDRQRIERVDAEFGNAAACASLPV